MLLRVGCLRCLLILVCCVLFVVCSLFRVVRCLLFVVCCVVFVVGVYGRRLCDVVRCWCVCFVGLYGCWLVVRYVLVCLLLFALCVMCCSLLAGCRMLSVGLRLFVCLHVCCCLVVVVGIGVIDGCLLFGVC